MERFLAASVVLVAVTLPTGAQGPCAKDVEEKLGNAHMVSGFFAKSTIGLDAGTALVGDIGDDELGSQAGAVHVFRQSLGWKLPVQKLLASDGHLEDFFGFDVDIEGNLAAVGAPGSLGASGKAYVFEFDGTAWIEQQQLHPDPLAGGRFGWSVSLDGDGLLIGAWGDSLETGAAYVFRRSGGVWVKEQKLVASDGENEDRFGYAVALEDGVAVVGAYGENEQGYRAGAAYAFRHDGAAWNEEAKLLAPDGGPDDTFGTFVELSGGRALISAWLQDVSTGAAYVFDGAAGWGLDQKLLPQDAAQFDYFGSCLALQGDVALVGAYGDDDHGGDSGSVYAFRRNSTGWVETQKLRAADGTTSLFFGIACALDGGMALIGSQPPAFSFGLGPAYVAQLDDLGLMTGGGSVFAGTTAQSTTCGGLPGQPVGLALVQAGTTPLFAPLATGVFDLPGTWSVALAVPPGLTGVTIGLRSYGIHVAGAIGASNLETLVIQ
jgi:hypothetical protein